jgi:HK97 family phage portal protein
MTENVALPRYRVKAPSHHWKIDKTEGQPNTTGPWHLPITGGWLSSEAGSSWNWWQRGFNVEEAPISSIVEACVSAYSQTVAMCPGDHWRLNLDTNGRERVRTSALTRFLKKPNDYQTISDFLLNAVRMLYQTGNTYALALRNDRYEITSLHLMNSRSCAALVAETGDIFYSLGGNVIIDRLIGDLVVPARDVLHIRLHTRSHNQLLGESPIVSAARDIAAGDAMAAQQLAFYLNQAKPSIVLSTDMVLDKTQVDALRDRWNEQTRGMGSGGTPILTAGLKPLPISSNADDSQLAEIMKMSAQNVALAYRIPLQILGLGGTSFASTELLMQSWLASSLGFCLNHIEEAFGKLFGLGGQPDDYLELNTSALLRSALKDRMESLAKGVIGGILSPDEARASEGYPKVPGGFGEEPRVQQQVVPLSAAAAIPAAPAAPPAGGAPAATTPKPEPAKQLLLEAPKDETDVNEIAARGYDQAEIDEQFWSLIPGGEPDEESSVSYIEQTERVFTTRRLTVRKSRKK